MEANLCRSLSFVLSCLRLRGIPKDNSLVREAKVLISPLPSPLRAPFRRDWIRPRSIQGAQIYRSPKPDRKILNYPNLEIPITLKSRLPSTAADAVQQIAACSRNQSTRADLSINLYSAASKPIKTPGYPKVKKYNRAKVFCSIIYRCEEKTFFFFLIEIKKLQKYSQQILQKSQMRLQ